MQFIYLDYNASTPIDPVVLAPMRPFLQDRPRSAQRPPSKLLAAKSQHFSAATTMRLFLPAAAARPTISPLRARSSRRATRGDHIITTLIEHPSIIEPCRFLERLGAQVTYLPVDRTGRIDPDDLRRHHAAHHPHQHHACQ
jgi:cysteine desulfurase